ncbi:MAG: D-cysteine desulfhydrase family protein [Candidatus Schekmanbacteria bacterium]|nr:D-cysteine desulfhydrase family protein [Candidatus Schekmanbacteria bacterium]
MLQKSNRFPQRINLATLPTPLHPLKRVSGLVPKTEIIIKRDDLTGCTLSGNKARKLEFLLADAQKQKSTMLITCGGIQSNHARSCAIAGRQVGLKSLLVLRGEEPEWPEANLMLDWLTGAQIKYVNRQEYSDRASQLMLEEAERLKAEGEIPYIIPEGGSNALGSMGYAVMINEIKRQLRGRRLDYIVTPVGSGGTMAGLVMGTQLFKLHARVIGINICANAHLFVERVKGIIREAKETLDLTVYEDGNWEIVDGYVGEGYAVPYAGQIIDMRTLAEKEGIILEPIYTGKAFHGLLSEIKNGRFGENKRILFLHTGGIFGLFTQYYSRTLFGK